MCFNNNKNKKGNMTTLNNNIVVCTTEQLTQIIDAAIEKRLTTIQKSSEYDQYPELLTRIQVAEMLGCSKQTIDNWRRDGRLKKYNINRTVRFKKAEVLKSFQTFHKHQRVEHSI